LIASSAFGSTKRGLRAPLLFLALSLSAAGSVYASPLLWLAALTVLGGTALLLTDGGSTSWTPLGFAVCGFALWTMATNLCVNPSYSAAGIYHPAFLVGGYVLGRRAGRTGAPLVYGTGTAFALCLATWAIWQRFGGEARSHALFETPATLAACLNFALLPGAVLVATRQTSRFFVPVLALLAAASLASTSRGGWLALAFGAVVALALLRHARMAIAAHAYAAVAAVLIGGALLLAAAAMYSAVGMQAVRSASERFALYHVALQAIGTSSPWLGSGYLAYYYFVDAAVPAVRTAANTPFYFVHNDYLQVLLELGVPGFAALLALVLLPVVTVWRSLGQASAEDRPALVGIAAATSAMAAHAAVDFPFYVPVCLAMYGIALGLVAALTCQAVEARAEPRPIFRRIAVAAVATLTSYVLLKPAVADACALRANEQWRAGHGENAAFWFEVARRVEPRDWRYHWYAGQFWFAQARVAHSASAAQRADAAFSDGIQANPRDVRNVLGRLATQRQLHEILPEPLADAALDDLAKRAARLAPHGVPK